MLLLFTLISVVAISSHTTAEVYFADRTSFVELGASLLHYITFDNNETPIKCSLYYNNSNNIEEKVELNLKNENINHDGNTNNTKSKIQSLGRNVCGFKLINFTYSDPEAYVLNVEYLDRGKTKQSSFAIYSTIKSPAQIKDEVIRVKLGEPVHITCGRQYSLHNELYNPHGELVQHGARFDHDINAATMRDFGVWNCTYGLAGILDPLYRYTNVTLIPEEAYVQTWYKEDGAYGVLGCRVIYEEEYNMGNVKKIPPFCQLIKPNRQIVTVSSNHRADGRYTSIGTNLTDYKCQIEFELPLLIEEIGEWECNIFNTGGYINTIAQTGTKRLTQNLVKYVKIGEKAQIKCDASYSIDECAIQAPNGSFVSGGGNFKEFYMGQCRSCEFVVTKADMGVWRCYMSRPDSFEDSLITVEMQNYKMMKASVVAVEVDEFDSMELMCRANSELVGCYFIDPIGRSFHASQKKKFSEVQYVGRGLEMGDCGVRLERVTADDDGLWRCIGLQGTSDENYEISDKISVQVNKKRILTTATSIGLTTGVVICFLVAFALVFYYKKHNKMIN